MSRMRMMAEIANADAIVVNPTHVSVAIKYDAAKGAPRVVAKGADVIAARIREEASKHGVPMVEDVPLARTLYRLCEIGDEIPAQSGRWLLGCWPSSMPCAQRSGRRTPSAMTPTGHRSRCSPPERSPADADPPRSARARAMARAARYGKPCSPVAVATNNTMRSTP